VSMKYHAPTKQLTVAHSDLEYCCHALRHSLRHIRDMAGLPHGKYVISYPMSDADHAQAGIFEAAKALGIDLGSDRFNELDVSV